MRRRSILKPYADTWSGLARVIHPLLVAFAGWLVFQIYLHPKPEFQTMPLRYQMALLVGLLVTIVVFSRLDVYRPWRGIPISREIRTVTVAWVLVIITLILITFLAKLGNEFSRVWIVSWALSGWLLLIAFRLSVRWVLRRGRRQGKNLRHVVLIGSATLIQHVQQRLRMAPWTGFQIQAVFTEHPEELIQGEQETVLPLDQARDYIRTHDPDQIWIAFVMEEMARYKALIKEVQETMTVPVRLIPDLYDFSLVNYTVTEVAGMPVFTLNESPHRGINRLVKRLEDIVGGVVLVLLTSPLLVMISLLIWASSGRPVFYRQERVSWNGRIFRIWKFRTMPVTAEAMSGPVWARKNDPRPTLIGRWLRRTSLDELPQLFNVLKGDMSLVGPRPERPVFVEEFRHLIPDYMQKHLVKAGITGWAQISGLRGDTDLQLRIQADLYYIENWSLWFDLKILLLTPFKGVLAPNAY
ncbi:MAG: undecaprenyl-phosphate glucose phosphotransferase [Candidatus Neomarinimicrobiota bacterium]|nr:MAG: undecaprenyl-phosphate glucose phosphotransferase [Candidatus Neomarinimicrobiota bacterium]